VLKKLIIAENIIEPSSWLTFEVENVLDAIMEHFTSWPETAKLYHDCVSEENNITPETKTDIENILKMDGTFLVLVYPAGHSIIQKAFGNRFVKYEPSAMITMFSDKLAERVENKIVSWLVPNVASSSSSDSRSSNNSLSGRSNDTRALGRIPDIFGQVRAYPDLIAQPYTFFVKNVELEHSYMCLGRGYYDIADVREDTTLSSQIEGSSVEFYDPGTSPNSGDDPAVRIGDAINLNIKNVKRYSSVDGQLLTPPDALSIQGDSNVMFTINKEITIDADASVDFNDFFKAGDHVVVSNATQSSPYYNFAGTYVIATVDEFTLTLSDPESVNNNWTNLIGSGVNSEKLSALLVSDSIFWVGPFIIEESANAEIWCNFVAANGIYTDDGTTKSSFPVTIRIGVTPVNSSDVAIGSEETYEVTLQWISTNKKYYNVGGTLKTTPTFTGRCAVRARRITNKNTSSGAVQDVQWRDMYGVIPVSKTEFGNVTTIQALTKATPNALAVSERKLNLLATRMLPTRISGSTFTDTLTATKRIDDIISFLSLDKYNGNRSADELDFDNIYSTVQSVIDYFGISEAAEFSYTFDTINMSFEEMLFSICAAGFCTPYRSGSKIKLLFEKENNIPTILFNHRNKIPSSETRSVSFGNVNDYDGVEYTYVDADDYDASVKIYIPSDQSAINATKIDSLGVRNYHQAYIAAHRAYNKLNYQTMDIEFQSTQDGNICMLNDRVLITDGTRGDKIEGEIVAQNVLELELSQDVDLEDGKSYTIFLQNTNGIVESVGITKTSEANKVLLNASPSFSIVTDPLCFAKTTFAIVENDTNPPMAFLITEKSPDDVMTVSLSAVNYDSRYYQNDKDFYPN